MDKDVWHHMKTYGMLEERQAVGAAVSGGPDSMALLTCLCRLSETYGFTVTALHFDHGTRNGASARDAEFVRSYCDEHAIPVHCERADVPRIARERGIGLELAAREAREDFFSRVVADGIVDVVATAHHMDDNAESVMMHMVRGCGLRGLTGIHPKRGHLIRPLLGVTRRQIEQYLTETATPFIVDASNEDMAFSRNYVRREIMPRLRDGLNPSAARAISRLSKSASEDADCLDELAACALQDCLQGSGPEEVVLDAGELAKKHPAIGSRVVRKALSMLGRDTDVEREHIETVLEAAKDGRTGRRFCLGGGFCAEVSYGLITVRHEAGKSLAGARSETQLLLPGTTVLPDGSQVLCGLVEEPGAFCRGGLLEYADADRLPQGAVIRTRRPGDVFRPLGGAGTKKLKDYFIDRKTPRGQRDETLLLANGSDILWIIGGMLSQDIALREGTKRICRLEYLGRQTTKTADAEAAESASCGSSGRGRQ